MGRSREAPRLPSGGGPQVAVAARLENTVADAEMGVAGLGGTNKPGARSGDEPDKSCGADTRNKLSADAAGQNLDSGYAWLILVVMTLIQSSISGTSRIYGLVYAKQVAVGYYDREQASWPIATASAVENLASILTPALARYLSWRKIELLSTLLFIASNLLAYASSSLFVDILALGIVQGFALSTSTVLSLAINNDYFERFRTTAYGISLSGSTLGVLYLSPLVSWLLRTYDNFRLVYLALAGVFCVNLVLVLFIKPRAQTFKPSTIGASSSSSSTTNRGFDDGRVANAKERTATNNPARKESRFSSLIERKNSLAVISYSAKVRRASVWSGNGTRIWQQNSATQLIQYGLDKLPSKNTSAPTRAASQVQMGKSASSADLARKAGLNHSPSSPSMIVAADSVRPTNGCHLEEEAKSNGRSVPRNRVSCVSTVTLPVRDSQKSPAEIILSPCDQSIGVKIASKININSEASGEIVPPPSDSGVEFSWRTVRILLRTPYLHCTWIMLCMYYLIARIFVIIIVDFAEDHGLTLEESTSLLNYWSLGDLVGRIFLGSLIDLNWMSCKNCIACTCLFLSMSIVSVVVFEGFYIYAACATLVAALISLEYMLINALMVEYVGTQYVTSCYSIAAFISSTVLFLRPTLIGLFRDQLGSYDGLLLLLAAYAGIFAVLFYALEGFLVRRWPKKRVLI